MARHAENPLRCSGVFEVLDLLFTVATFEAVRTERLVTSQDRKILDLLPAGATVIGAFAAN